MHQIMLRNKMTFQDTLLFSIAWLVCLASNGNAQQPAATEPDNAVGQADGYHSDWQGSRIWIGPDWWANPMTEWSLKKGTATAPALKDRTLCLLAADLGGEGSAFEATVQIEAVGIGKPKGNVNAKRKGVTKAGFRMGRRGGIDDFRHALVHAKRGIDATITADGHLSLGDELSQKTLSLDDGPVLLRLKGRRVNEVFELTLAATRDDQSITVSKSFGTKQIAGGVSLLSNSPQMKANAGKVGQFVFRDFQLSGDLVQHHAERTFGPILWSQYTLNNNQLRLLAQFAPLSTKADYEAELWTAEEGDSPDWNKVSTEPMHKLSRTVTFTVDDWSSTTSRLYQVRFRWREKEYVWDGRVRSEPAADEPLKLGCFSCDNGYLFPIPAMVSQVKKQDPDMVFFAGDQIYGTHGGFGINHSDDSEAAMIDYLRKYCQFGWTWRDILKDRPSVILPDDHDVFQGNIWGHGGRALPESDAKNPWDLGGYTMPGDWVAAVEKTNVGHLPDPAVDRVLPIGIKPYFTSLNYGGVGFVILEDRKFKTGPLSLPEETRADGADADLLGKEQEAFLKRWSEDWNGQRMKCALTQTIFCTAATHIGKNLKRSKSFFDSGAWPKAARSRAVKIMADCNAFAIHGDQHLGVLLRQGLDDFDDAGYAFMVPGTANGFPRAWWPGVKNGTPEPGQDFTGKFRDDAGNPIHVLAVGNPEPGSNALPKSENPMTIGYRKGSGYGIVEFNKADFTAKVSLYRLGDQEEMFDGFPKTIKIGGKPK